MNTNFPTYQLKSGSRIMTQPVLSEEFGILIVDGQNVALPPYQPAVYITYQEATDWCAKQGGRLPTEDEWMELFNLNPYCGGILEWTYTKDNLDIVLRGGSWCDSARYCRSAFRCRFGPGVRFRYFGFRCVWD